MERKLHSYISLVIALAMCFCFDGCGSKANENSEPSTTLSSETGAFVHESETTESDDSVSETTAFVVPTTQNVQTEQSDKGEKKEPQTSTSQTQQSQPEQVKTALLDATLANSVVTSTVSALKLRLPDLIYDASWSGGTVVKLSVAPNQTLEAMSDSMVANVWELFEYQSVDYIYSLAYAGLADDDINHCFEFSYIIEVPDLVQPSFSGADVVAQVTDYISNCQELNITAFDGTGYKECIRITDVPLFYSTEKAVSFLKDAVAWEIESRNLADAVFSRFQLVYDSQDDDSHVFLLYLM